MKFFSVEILLFWLPGRVVGPGAGLGQKWQGLGPALCIASAATGPARLLGDRDRFPIVCPLEPSRYLASFSRYLAPKLQQRLLRDDVINDVIRPMSTIREEHIDIPHTGTLC